MNHFFSYIFHKSTGIYFHRLSLVAVTHDKDDDFHSVCTKGKQVIQVGYKPNMS